MAEIGKVKLRIAIDDETENQIRQIVREEMAQANARAAEAMKRVFSAAPPRLESRLTK